MVVGFNHNFRYKGTVYHVQTEDGGLKNPRIITLLYQGGTILASKKTSYADITRVDGLEKVVEELMKEQHKEMLRRLKNGEFDAVIAGARPRAAVPAGASAPPPVAPEPVASPSPELEKARGPRVEQASEGSLDEIILSYLVSEEEEKKRS
jgi:hypothetical protein